MDVKRTRELLGEKVAKMKDEEIGKLILRTSRELDAIFKLVIKKQKFIRKR